MKARLLVVAGFVLTVVPFTFTQQVSTKPRTVEPPQMQKVVSQPDTWGNQAVADMLAFEPQIPRGPVDILHEYEQQMTLISQTFSAEMAGITQAVYRRQVTRDQAEYLMQQKYQIAMMQYEVLNALHDSLAFDVSRTHVAPQSQASEAETTIVVQPPVPMPLDPSAPRPN